MAWTTWLKARNVTLFENDSVAMDPNRLISLTPIHSVALSSGRMQQYGSTALLFKDFGVNGVATAVEASIRVDRLSRIQDKTIQLYTGSGLVGKNLADLSADNQHTYSWVNISYSINSEFGVVIDYQPNTAIPSREILIIRSVLLRFDI
jgi:hypothetical protein